LSFSLHWTTYLIETIISNKENYKLYFKKFSDKSNHKKIFNNFYFNITVIFQKN
jgi:hypothetical protein